MGGPPRALPPSSLDPYVTSWSRLCGVGRNDNNPADTPGNRANVPGDRAQASGDTSGPAANPEDTAASFKVGEVAGLARISVRTLHHYEHVGLLAPSARSESGYRLYGPADLERLQQILFYKELGFSLDEIRDAMDDPDFDRREALLAQREMLREHAQRIVRLLESVDRTLISLEGGIHMTDEEMFEAFEGFDPADYEDEVRERWGDTDAYRESARRTKAYTKQDWERFRAESEEIGLAIVALMDEGVPPQDPRAMDQVERYRRQIDRWFYTCSHEMHANLGRMYVADPRFTATYEKVHVGMAQYVCDAIQANAARMTAD
jgi:DNA-binding transcriptional MerR regulator